MAIPPAFVAAVPSFVGAIVGSATSRRERIAAETQTRKLREQDRGWFERDRQNERDYARSLTQGDRAYFEQTTARDRAHARSVLVDDRSYSRSQTDEQRQYDRQLTQSDRTYAANKLSEQRGYDREMYQRDLVRYDGDRDKMQLRSNDLAERSTASRGIDFTKLRDDAMKAGYNPMTALSMAHAYSTDVNYSLQGGPYSPGANYTTSNQGYMPMSGSGGGASGGGASGPIGSPSMPSHVAAGGGFSAGGGGYQSAPSSALSTGAFVADALQRSLDTWSNEKQQGDPLADALRGAFAQDQMASQVRDADYSQDFGYSLTKQEPFQPSGRVGVPALASGSHAVAPPKMPSGMMEVGGRKYIPVTKPDGKPGRLEASVARRLDIEAFDTVSPGDWAEIVGEIGEVESGINNPAIRRNILDEWHRGVPLGDKVRDYFKSGITGNTGFDSIDNYTPSSRRVWW